jgi:hypothetical protein
MQVAGKTQRKIPLPFDADLRYIACLKQTLARHPTFKLYRAAFFSQETIETDILPRPRLEYTFNSARRFRLSRIDREDFCSNTLF